MYRVIQSPQLLKLATSLGSHLKAWTPKDPFQRLEVIVANRDTAQWLKLVLAEQCGITANIEFLLPSEWLWARIRERWPEVKQHLPSDRGPMTWSIYAILSDPEQLSSFPELANWIDQQGGVHSESVRHLAGQISSVFDQYQVYRPWMLSTWESAAGGYLNTSGRSPSGREGGTGPIQRDGNGRSGNFQDEWDSEARSQQGEGSEPAKQYAVGRQLNLMDPPLELPEDNLPEGSRPEVRTGGGAAVWQQKLWLALKQRWASLPDGMRPDRAALYRRLYEFTEDEFTEDEVSGQNGRREQPIILFNSGLLPPPVARLLQRLSRRETVLHYRISSVTKGSADLAETTAPRFLMNLSGEQREQERQFATFEERQNGTLQREHLPPDVSTGSNLATIQRAISRGEAIPALSTPDDSIVINACHSPLREVETLHQFLLERFSEQDDLTPDDVLVVTPNLETYAPFIEAVFGTVEEGLPAIPWHCGVGRGRTSAGCRAFLRLLNLSGGRIKREELIDFLEQTAVGDRFGFTSSDRQRISTWMEESGVTWGLDGEHRAEFDVPGEDHQSWGEAMRRGWLGQLISDRPGTLYQGLLLNPDISSSEERLLWSRLQEVLDLMSRVNRAALNRYPAVQWQKVLKQWVQRFLPESHRYEADRLALHNAIDTVVGEIERGGYEGELSFSLIVQELSEAIGSGSSRTSRFDRGVLFNSMVPVRSLPFRVIALLGLSDDDFPRKPVHPEFDLMASDPRPDERDRKREDRNLFLESVMAAGSVHYCSYTGRNQSDDEPIPPSPILGEWIDTVAAAMNQPVDSIVSTQRLNGFSRALFAGDAPRSFSKISLQAARNASSTDGIRGLDIDRELPVPDEGEPLVLLDDLERFFNNPAGSFFRQRLGISIRSPQLHNAQEFAVDNLTAHQLFSRVFGWLAGGMPESEAETLLLKSGRLPAHLPGEHLALETVEQAKRALQSVRERGMEPVAEQVAVDVSAGGWRVRGVLPARSRSAPLDIFVASPSGRRLMKGWIRHLIRCVMTPESEPDSLLLFSNRKGDEWRTLSYEPMADELLARLIGRYRSGLCTPVNLYMESACAYQESLHRGEEKALEVAMKTWAADFYFPERADPYLELILGREADGDRDMIRQIAEELYAPLFKRLEVA